MHATKHRKKTFSLLNKSEADVGYLLRRAGFGAQPAQVQTAAAQGLGVAAISWSTTSRHRITSHRRRTRS